MEENLGTTKKERSRSVTMFLAVMVLLVAASGLYAVWFPRGGEVAGGGHLRSLTSQEFDAAVASGVVLVDFWAPWCGPCRQQLPILEDVARRVEGRAAVMKVNVDEEPEVAGRFGVQAIPTLILLQDGRPVQRFVGVQSARALVGAIDAAGAGAAGHE